LRSCAGFCPASIDFVLTDPPYVANYTSNDSRSVPNDDNEAWLKPAFAEIYRLLRRNRFCVSFCAWNSRVTPKSQGPL
jgi:site-specific DNA-methyltransferase (adenine-specific)